VKKSWDLGVTREDLFLDIAAREKLIDIQKYYYKALRVKTYYTVTADFK